MAETVHRKEQGKQRTHRVVPATDATGKKVGSYVFRITEDGPKYVGEGDSRGDWEPNEDLTNEDAPQSALETVVNRGEN